ncbi:energy-coupling factor transporter ATP-binding protein EcfA2 [Luteibacter sp. HA06]
MTTTAPSAQAYHVDFSLNTLGWKAFQDLCAQVCEEEYSCTVSVYREAQDGGQDACFFLSAGTNGASHEATVQCKFSSKAERRLKASDISAELDSVRELAASGKADTYIFITSMGVDASVATAIRGKLLEAGVRRPHVLGREWLTAKIRASARLRALVPRVYGLGDLASILDERAASQTRSLLGHLLPSLKIYVPTTSHRTAVRLLGSHKLVLLLGAPATGKSTLAAILATMAIDTQGLECLKCEGPLEMRPRWNPHDNKRLFWIDDAFGPNQLREDYVDAWTEFMPKMKAALDQGNHFILTSRTHIWNEARHKLGTRNHPLLENRKSVVDVGSLSPEERQQILYNHVKSGNQSHDWRRLIKPYLPSLADDTNLLPEIARRLGDAAYTTQLRKLPSDLSRFVHEPQEFLIGTIRELATAQQAALTLVFLFRSRLLPTDIESDEGQLVADKYATSVAAMARAIEQLDGTFLVKRKEGGQHHWSFVHPTFADAISGILSAAPDLVGLYVRGTKLATLLAEAVCEGAPHVADAVVVPKSSGDALILRLLETPDEKNSNEELFQFLNRRATPHIVQNVLAAEPGLASRRGQSPPWVSVRRRAEILLRATAFSLGLLEDETRQLTCEFLHDAATERFDASFVSEQLVLDMFSPFELMKLTVRLVVMLEDTVPSRISEIEEEADADADIDDQFEPVTSFLSDMHGLAMDSMELTDRLTELENYVREAKGRVEGRKSTQSEDSFFTSIPSASISEEAESRSIFSDVDE